jgi:hypothetical protein
MQMGIEAKKPFLNGFSAPAGDLLFTYNHQTQGVVGKSCFELSSDFEAGWCIARPKSVSTSRDGEMSKSTGFVSDHRIGMHSVNGYFSIEWLSEGD